MNALKLPGRHRVRRRFRLVSLRAVHALTHHYLSLISLAIVAGLIMLTLTSASFEVGADALAEAPAAARYTPLPTVTPGIAPAIATALVEPRQVVYYVVDSELRREEIEMAVQADISNDAMRNYKPLHGTNRFFLMVSDARDEAEVLEFLRQLAISPPVDGTNVRVVDLR